MSSWDWDAGYDRSDPKHPEWAGAMADAGDLARKRAKENPATWEEIAVALVRGHEDAVKVEREWADALLAAEIGLALKREGT